MGSIKEWYVADFETTSDRFYKENGYTKVWLYAVCDSNAVMSSLGYSIEEFFKDLYTKYIGKIIYFHNLKFDGQFILSYLLSNGYEYKEELKVRDGKGFTTLIGELGEFYCIKINFSKGRQVQIHDSLKIIPLKVSQIAIDFKLPILKEHIDYDNYDITPEKIVYIQHDVKIVAMALKEVKEHGLDRMTTASSAYHYYTASLSENQLNRFYPELDDKFMSDYREAYRGGRAQVNPMYQGKLLHNVRRYDINSMYPSIMHNDPLPYGKPIPISRMGDYKFEVYIVEMDIELKPNHMPSLLMKGFIFGDTTYYMKTDGIEVITLTSIDLKLVYRNYYVKYFRFIEGYGFHTSTMLFKDYVDHFYVLKQQSEGGKKFVYKRMLNSLYGKYGSKPKARNKIPYMDENGVVHYRKSEEHEMRKYYNPTAMAITSYGHLHIDDGIVATGYENFVYCDTDSIHTLGTLPEEFVDNKELGKFKLEAIEETAKYIRQKCYITKEEGNIHITSAGMNDEIKDSVIQEYGDEIFNVFEKGFKATGKLLPRNVKGGVVLYETSFQIKY